jgi:acetyl-CoA synthetase
MRTFTKWGSEIPGKFDPSSLRLLGSVGESINPEAWLRYREHIGRDRRLLRDVAEQHEIGDVTTLAESGVRDLISKGLSA